MINVRCILIVYDLRAIRPLKISDIVMYNDDDIQISSFLTIKLHHQSGEPLQWINDDESKSRQEVYRMKKSKEKKIFSNTRIE